MNIKLGLLKDFDWQRQSAMQHLLPALFRTQGMYIQLQPCICLLAEDAPVPAWRRCGLMQIRPLCRAGARPSKACALCK